MRCSSFYLDDGYLIFYFCTIEIYYVLMYLMTYSSITIYTVFIYRWRFKINIKRLALKLTLEQQTSGGVGHVTVILKYCYKLIGAYSKYHFFYKTYHTKTLRSQVKIVQNCINVFFSSGICFLRNGIRNRIPRAL